MLAAHGPPRHWKIYYLPQIEKVENHYEGKMAL